MTNNELMLRDRASGLYTTARVKGIQEGNVEDIVTGCPQGATATVRVFDIEWDQKTVYYAHDNLDVFDLAGGSLPSSIFALFEGTELLGTLYVQNSAMQRWTDRAIRRAVDELFDLSCQRNCDYNRDCVLLKLRQARKK